MPARGEVFASGNYNHIYNRGASRGQIFFEAASCEYCLRLIKKYQPHDMVSVIAYCLMPNHYHYFVPGLQSERDQEMIAQYVWD
jgi:putative transposase